MSYTDTLFWIYTRSPIRTRWLPTKTFCPSEQPAPISAPPRKCGTQCQMRLLAPMRAPSSTMADGWWSSRPVQRQGMRASRAGAVDGGQQGQRLQAFAAVGFGSQSPRERIDDIVVVQLVPETVDRRGFVIGFADLVVIRMRFGKLPFVDAVGPQRRPRGTVPFSPRMVMEPSRFCG